MCSLDTTSEKNPWSKCFLGLLSSETFTFATPLRSIRPWFGYKQCFSLLNPQPPWGFVNSLTDVLAHPLIKRNLKVLCTNYPRKPLQTPSVSWKQAHQSLSIHASISFRYLILFHPPTLASALAFLRHMLGPSLVSMMPLQCIPCDVLVSLPIISHGWQPGRGLTSCLRSLPCPDKRNVMPDWELMFTLLDCGANGVCYCPQHLVMAPHVPPLSLASSSKWSEWRAQWTWCFFQPPGVEMWQTIEHHMLTRSGILQIQTSIVLSWLKLDTLLTKSNFPTSVGTNAV